MSLGPVLWVDFQGAPGGLDGDCSPGMGRLPAAIRTATSAGDVFGRGASPTSLALVDVTGRRDGHMDLLLLLPNGSVAVAWNNGSDFFPDPVTVLAGSGCTVVATADVNADLVPDVLTGGSMACAGAWAGSGNGATGSFTRLLELSTALVQLGPVSSLVTADLDCNGNLDVLAATGAGVFAVLLARGGGVLGVRPVFNESWAGRSGPVTALALGDVTGDGVVDAVGCCGGSASSVGGVVVLAGDCVSGVHTRTWLSAPMGPCAGLAVGDLAADGGLDIVVSGATAGAPVQVLVNHGHGSSGPVFVEGRVVGAGPAAVAVVDVDDDGLLDVPGAGFLAAHGDLAPEGIPLYVRPLGRDAGWNQHGATVCVVHAESGARAGCRVVDGGGSGGSQGPYDAHFRVPVPVAVAAVVYNVTVGFVGGHAHSAWTSRACSVVVAVPSSPAGTAGAVAVVRDVPAVASLSLSPGAGPLRLGGVLAVTLTALWGEADLQPAPPPACCTVNGADVAATFTRAGNGTYHLTYVAREGDPLVWLGPPAFALALRDPRFPDAVSDGATPRHLIAPYAGFSIDTQAPRVTFTCGPLNGTTRPTDNETVCVSCGVETHEATLGCVVYFRRLGPVPDSDGGALCNATAGSRVNHTAAFVHRHQDAPAVQFWAVDAAGNVGPTTMLAWVVDSLVPATLWPPFTYNTSLSNSVSPELPLSCSRSGCRFSYVLDGGPVVLVGGADEVGAAGGLGNNAPNAVLDTTAALVTLKTSPATTADVRVVVRVNGTVTPLSASPNASLVLQVRVDGAVGWTDVRAAAGAGVDFAPAAGLLRLASLAPGPHSVEVRAVGVGPDVWGEDATPWLLTWTVARQAPEVTFLRTPPAHDPVPRAAAVVVVTVPAPHRSTVAYQLWALAGPDGWAAVNVSGGAPLPGNASATWVLARAGPLAFTALTPGVQYRLDVSAVDSVAGAGPVASVLWRTQACVTASNVSLASLTVDAVDAGTVHVSWQLPPQVPLALVAGFVVSVDGGAWEVVRLPGVTVPGVVPAPAQPRELRVRAVALDACGGAAGSAAWPVAVARWTQLEAPPGAVRFTATPTPLLASAFAAFVLAASAPPSTVTVQCSVDGGGWHACGPRRVALGPLSQGPHMLAVRAVDVASGVPGAETAHAWTVQVDPRAALLLQALPDGARTLTVGAQAAGVPSVPSQSVVAWMVDTRPPGLSAALVSPVLTNATHGVVEVVCTGEARPSRCLFCYRVSVDSQWGPAGAARTCEANTTLRVSVPRDGAVALELTPVDGAGNTGAVTVVRWTQDTVQPVCTASPPPGLPDVAALAAPGVSLSYLALAVTASEPVAVYVVTLSRARQSWEAVGVPAVTALSERCPPLPGGVINVTITLQGLLAVTVTAVDFAGNEGPASTSFPIVAATQGGVVALAQPVAALTRVSAVAFSVTTRQLRQELLAGVRMLVARTGALPGAPGPPPPLTLLSGVEAELAPLVATQQAIVFPPLPSAAYAVTLCTLDILGRCGAPLEVLFVVDVDAPVPALAPPLVPSFLPAPGVTVGAAASDAHSPAGLMALARLDGGPWVPVASGTAGGVATFSGLQDGAHTVEVSARDGAGNDAGAPFPTASFVVDTVTPGVALQQGNASGVDAVVVWRWYVTDPWLPLCLVTSDATPVRPLLTLQAAGGGGAPQALPLAPPVSAGVDLGGLASGQLHCGTLGSPPEGNYSVTAVVTDAAGNSASPQARWVVLDTTPPVHRVQRLPPPAATACFTRGDTGVTVCDSPAALRVVLECLPETNAAQGEGASGTVTSPCGLQWAVIAALHSGGCGSSDPGTGGGVSTDGVEWRSTGTPALTLDLSPLVVGLMGGAAQAQLQLYTRAVDGAGNAEPAQRLTWFVDTLAPGAPTVTRRFAEVTRADAVTFDLAVADESPGTSEFLYRLTDRAGSDVAVAGTPRATIPVAAPSAPGVQVSTLTLANLRSDMEYVLTAWVVDHAGHVGPSTSVSWEQVAVEPRVALVLWPDAVSGAVFRGW